MCRAYSKHNAYLNHSIQIHVGRETNPLHAVDDGTCSTKETIQTCTSCSFMHRSLVLSEGPPIIVTAADFFATIAPRTAPCGVLGKLQENCRISHAVSPGLDF